MVWRRPWRGRKATLRPATSARKIESDGGAVRGVHLDLADVVEERVEARSSEDADLRRVRHADLHPFADSGLPSAPRTIATDGTDSRRTAPDSGYDAVHDAWRRLARGPPDPCRLARGGSPSSTRRSARWPPATPASGSAIGARFVNACSGSTRNLRCPSRTVRRSRRGISTTIPPCASPSSSIRPRRRRRRPGPRAAEQRCGHARVPAGRYGPTPLSHGRAVAQRLLAGRLRGRAVHPVPRRDERDRDLRRGPVPRRRGQERRPGHGRGDRRPDARLQLRVSAVVRVRPTLGVSAGPAGELPRPADRSGRAADLSRVRQASS